MWLAGFGNNAGDERAFESREDSREEQKGTNDNKPAGDGSQGVYKFRVDVCPHVRVGIEASFTVEINHKRAEHDPAPAETRAVPGGGPAGQRIMPIPAYTKYAATAN